MKHEQISWPAAGMVTNMDETAAVSTWLHSYLQAFRSASFQVLSNGFEKQAPNLHQCSKKY